MEEGKKRKRLFSIKRERERERGRTGNRVSVGEKESGDYR